MKVRNFFWDKSLGPFARSFKLIVTLVLLVLAGLFALTVLTIIWMDVRWYFASPLLQSYRFEDQANKANGKEFRNDTLNGFKGSRVAAVVDTFERDGFTCSKSSDGSSRVYCRLEVNDFICVPTWYASIEYDANSVVTDVSGAQRWSCL